MHLSRPGQVKEDATTPEIQGVLGVDQEARLEHQQSVMRLGTGLPKKALELDKLGGGGALRVPAGKSLNYYLLLDKKNNYYLQILKILKIEKAFLVDFRFWI